MNSEGEPSHGSDLLGLFDELVELEPDARAERLSRIGETDPELRRACEKLLAADAEADARLAHVDRAIGSAASRSARRSDGDPLKMIGRTVSHFRVVEPLAYGGMGMVYRAEDTQLRRAIALKFLLPTHRIDLNSKERFLHEARVAAALDHPNLCGIHEIGETDEGYLFYAMPLFPGETLKARLAREGPLPIADAIDIAKQIAHGLGAAHRAGVVHRDLKPANVMLLPDGSVKVLDFGLAKAKDLTLTLPQMVLGTAAYMAPEQVLEDPVDGRTDLWALGVVLYEMLTGRRPFEGQHEVSVAHAIVHKEPVRPSEIRQEVTAAIEDVVTALLRKDPSERCPSAETLIAALDAIQRGEPGGLRPRRDRSLVSRVRARVPARIAALAAVVLIALGVSGWFATRPAAAWSSPRRVAVLPFADVSDTAAENYLGVALSDAINTELARISALALPSFRSMLMYSGAAKPLPEAAADLGVVAAVGGRVQLRNGGVHGEVHVFDTKSRRSRWTRRYAGASALNVQREVTQAVVAALRVPLSDAERARLARYPTRNPAAYDLYLQGRHHQLQPLMGELAQAVVHEWDELTESLGVAAAPPAEESGDVA